MTDVAKLITDMVNAGVSAEIVGRVAAALAERDVVTVPVKDEQAERRRERDRERKRDVRRIPQNSADSAELKKESTKEKNIPPSPPKGGSGSTKTPENADFDAFWQAYPNKTGKPKAAEAYRRAVKRVPAEQILAGLEAAKRHDNRFRDRQFTPHPTSWLNSEGWTDEHQTETPQRIEQATDVAAWSKDQWEIRVKLAADHGRWDQRWGPPPDDPGTLCPPDLRQIWTRKAA